MSVAALQAQTSLYSSIVLKVSGEFLGSEGHFHNREAFEAIAEQLAALREAGVSVCVVVGGGNIIRGRDSEHLHMTRETADHAGMLATGVNALILGETCQRFGCPPRLICSEMLSGIPGSFPHAALTESLVEGYTAIVAGGSGRTGVSTDVPAAELAAAVSADAVIMLKQGTDGVYDRDPRRDGDAKKLREVYATDALAAGLEVMDSDALVVCLDSGIPIHIVRADEPFGVVRLLGGETLGSVVIPR